MKKMIMKSNVNDEEIETSIAQDDDFHPEKMKRLPRGAFLAKAGNTSDPKKTKVRVTLYLDSDVLAYFKERAAESHAAPYQTQINNELRDVMGRDIIKRNSKSIPVDYSLLLNNRTFIRAVAEEVAEYRAEGGEVPDQADV